MNSEAQRLAEEAKRLTETRPCRKDVILCMFECEGCVKVREAHAIIDRLASLRSADQAREIEIRAERYELGRAVALEESEARVARARAEALEEAAKACEAVSATCFFDGNSADRCAEAIRTLASTEQAARNEGEKR